MLIAYKGWLETAADFAYFFIQGKVIISGLDNLLKGSFHIHQFHKIFWSGLWMKKIEQFRYEPTFFNFALNLVHFFPIVCRNIVFLIFTPFAC